jgi:hypothetical protein
VREARVRGGGREGDPGGAQDAREAEVGQLDVRVVGVRGEQDVLRLDVAVDDALGVQVLERLQQLEHDLGRVALGEGLLGNDAVEQLAALLRASS